MNKAEETLENLTEVLIEGFKDGEFSIDFAEKISKVTEEYEKYKEMNKLISKIHEKVYDAEKGLAGVYLYSDLPIIEDTIHELREIKEYLAQLSNCNSGVKKEEKTQDV